MTSLLIAVALLAALGSSPARAQQSRRSGESDTTSPVSITRAATLRINVASAPAGVFEYLSDPAKLTRWFPDQAIFEPQIGGRYHFRWNNTEGLWSGVVTEFIRGNTLAFTWQPPGEPYETNVRFKLLPQGGETIVELRHSGFTSADALEKAIEAWQLYLQNLKSVIETGTDQRTKNPPGHMAPTRSRPRRPA